MKVRVVNCPQCGKPVEWGPASRCRPFCSERCRLIDLGAWASESYRVPLDQNEDDDTSAQDGAEERPRS